MGLLDYWRRRKGTRVYENIAQHWLERDTSLPEGGIPGSADEDEDERPVSPVMGRTRRQRLRRGKAAAGQDSLELHVPTRHVLILAAAIVVLLLTVAVLATVLATRS